MIRLYYWPTPNGHKITIFLEETGLPYEIHPVNIGRGDQFKPEFLKISPNNRMPAIVDTEPAFGGEPLSLFESGAILQYLADKTGKFLPAQGAARYKTLQWLYWQVGGLGPMAGQNNHFANYAPEKIPYAIKRYRDETNRLFKVMDNCLAENAYLAGDEFTIADMASYPWVVPYEGLGQSLEDFPNLKRWFESIKKRPAVERAYARGKEVSSDTTMDEEARKILFGQTAATLSNK